MFHGISVPILSYFFLLSVEIPIPSFFMCNSYYEHELFIIYMYGKYYLLENDLLLSIFKNVLREVFLIKVFCISLWFHGSCSLCFGCFSSHTKFKQIRSTLFLQECWSFTFPFEVYKAPRFNAYGVRQGSRWKINWLIIIERTEQKRVSLSYGFETASAKLMRPESQFSSKVSGVYNHTQVHGQDEPQASSRG